MNYTPKNLKRWTLPGSYARATWPEYYEAGFWQNRDSGPLQRSNFAVALAELRSIAVPKELDPDGGVLVVPHESHWAVGWVEHILIHESWEEGLRWADEAQAALADYPVLDDSHHSELEQKEADSIWRDCYGPKERIAYIRKHRSQFEFRDFADMLGCARGNYFAGYASELVGS